MLLFYKKGHRKDPINYQGINLLNATLKLTIKIITNNIRGILELALIYLIYYTRTIT